MTVFRTPRRLSRPRTRLANNIINASAATLLVGSVFAYWGSDTRQTELKGLEEEHIAGKGELPLYLAREQASKDKYVASMVAFGKSLDAVNAVPDTNVAKKLTEAKNLMVTTQNALQARDAFRRDELAWENRVRGCQQAVSAWWTVSSASSRARCRGVLSQPLTEKETAPQSGLAAIGSLYYAVRNPVIRFFGQEPGALEY